MTGNNLALHAQGKVFVDEVFDAVAAVSEAVAKHGADNVLNATIGSLGDEQGRLVMLPTVEKVFRSLASEDIAAYGSVRGLPGYLAAVVEQTFGSSRPDAYVEAVATAGGAGAIHAVIWNYSNIGDAVLTHDWYWQPYTALCADIARRLELFSLYDQHRRFNIQSFQAKVRALLGRQDNLVVILNAPNHNPTGYSLTDREWDQVLATVREYAAGGKAIVLLIDAAYLDYLPNPEEGRAFIRKFGGLPANILVAFAFSMSKGFTLYGQRTGAVIGVSADKGVIREFVNAVTITGRTRWSSVSRAAMKTMGEIFGAKELVARVSLERAGYVDLMRRRAEVFFSEAAAANLDVLPYSGGFFLSVPASRPQEASNRLRQSNIFVVPTVKGLRIAVCSVPVKKMAGLAARIAAAVAK
jgi:aromatic-amino-acid transaminase